MRTWKRASDGPVIATDEEIASLAVVRCGGAYLGIAQPLDLRRRRYWHSEDLRHWEPGPAVRFRTSGEPQTLSNPFYVDGQWMILYEQDDRIYRAVLQPR